MQQAKTIKVWDIGVRIFHWSLVLFFTVSYITGDELDTVHAWSGYAIVLLLLFRLVWGFVGTKYARFSNFIYSPARVKEYLNSLKNETPIHYLGHNPAGGWMVVLLLVFLSLTVWTGLEAYAAEGHGPLAQVSMSPINNAYADDDDDHEGKGGEKHEDSVWEDVHEFFVNTTLALVIIHIGGVVVSSRLHRENLVKAMLTGNKEEA